jgi:hypothetical protein
MSSALKSWVRYGLLDEVRLESKTRVRSGDRHLKGRVVVGTVPDDHTGR